MRTRCCGCSTRQARRAAPSLESLPSFGPAELPSRPVPQAARRSCCCATRGALRGGARPRRLPPPPRPRPLGRAGRWRGEGARAPSAAAAAAEAEAEAEAAEAAERRRRPCAAVSFGCRSTSFASSLRCCTTAACCARPCRAASGTTRSCAAGGRARRRAGAQTTPTLSSATLNAGCACCGRTRSW